MFEKSGDRPQRNFAPREMIKGNWTCSDCGKEITELPFEPAQDRPIYCRDCWAKRKPRNFRG